MRSVFLLVAAVLALAAVTVWQRAAIVHVGGEVAALRAQQAKLEEEERGLRMDLARLGSPAKLAQPPAGAKQPAWVFDDALTREKTREVIQHVRADVKP